MDDVNALCYYCVISISNNTCYDAIIDDRYWSGHNNNIPQMTSAITHCNNVLWCARYYWKMDMLLRMICVVIMNACYKDHDTPAFNLTRCECA